MCINLLVACQPGLRRVSGSSPPTGRLRFLDSTGFADGEPVSHRPRLAVRKSVPFLCLAAPSVKRKRRARDPGSRRSRPPEADRAPWLASWRLETAPVPRVPFRGGNGNENSREPNSSGRTISRCCCFSVKLFLTGAKHFCAPILCRSSYHFSSLLVPTAPACLDKFIKRTSSTYYTI